MSIHLHQYAVVIPKYLFTQFYYLLNLQGFTQCLEKHLYLNWKSRKHIGHFPLFPPEASGAPPSSGLPTPPSARPSPTPTRPPNYRVGPSNTNPLLLSHESRLFFRAIPREGLRVAVGLSVSLPILTEGAPGIPTGTTGVCPGSASGVD